MNQLKIVFMGTATFSEAVLKNLIQHDYNIVQVVSQPDRRVGRKKELKKDNKNHKQYNKNHLKTGGKKVEIFILSRETVSNEGR